MPPCSPRGTWNCGGHRPPAPPGNNRGGDLKVSAKADILFRVAGGQFVLWVSSSSRNTSFRDISNIVGPPARRKIAHFATALLKILFVIFYAPFCLAGPPRHPSGRNPRAICSFNSGYLVVSRPPFFGSQLPAVARRAGRARGARAPRLLPVAAYGAPFWPSFFPFLHWLCCSLSFPNQRTSCPS
jgi:hypothetical protein